MGKDDDGYRQSDAVRRANGIVVACITAFFIVHGLLGASALVFGFHGQLVWLVWIGVAFVGVHVVLSVATSYGQLADKQRPASPRKKRHLALKWATGCILALCVVAHVLWKDPLISNIAIIALAAALAVHLWVGSKSLLKDVGVRSKYMTLFRIGVCAFAALFIAAACVNAFVH